MFALDFGVDCGVFTFVIFTLGVVVVIGCFCVVGGDVNDGISVFEAGFDFGVVVVVGGT